VTIHRELNAPFDLTPDFAIPSAGEDSELKSHMVLLYRAIEQ
jgi:hypothetical protein